MSTCTRRQGPVPYLRNIGQALGDEYINHGCIQHARQACTQGSIHNVNSSNEVALFKRKLKNNSLICMLNENVDLI